MRFKTKKELLKHLGKHEKDNKRVDRALARGTVVKRKGWFCSTSEYLEELEKVIVALSEGEVEEREEVKEEKSESSDWVSWDAYMDAVNRINEFRKFSKELIAILYELDHPSKDIELEEYELEVAERYWFNLKDEF